MVALSLAIALIVTEYRPTFLGFGDLAAYALVMGAYGIGDFTGSIVAGSVRFRNPLSTMFLGYVVMGIGFAWLAVSVWVLPASTRTSMWARIVFWASCTSNATY